MLSSDDIEVADALVTDDTADGLCKGIGDGKLLHLGTTLGVGDRVCEDNFLKGRSLDTVTGRTTHHTVGGAGTDSLCTIRLHQVGSLGDGTSCINHIINDDNILSLHFADNLHGSYDIGTGTGLVAKHERAAKILGIGVGSL